jgi:undecaprenyl-diphosphatase
VPVALTAVEGSASLPELLLLALVQGVTEFLPVSSDGHLVLAQSWLALPGPHLAIDVALHLGTLLAVLVVFRRELLGVVRSALAGDRRELVLLLVGSIPAAIVGIAFESFFERLFQFPRAAALGLLVTAAFLLVGERARVLRGTTLAPRELDWRDALWIGSMQAVAILPGVSRSGTTISTALARGIRPAEAARFSFLLSVPAVAGAVVLQVPGLVQSGGFSAALALAVLATFAIGVLALRALLALLGRGAFLWYAVYCLVVGVGAWIANG